MIIDGKSVSAELLKQVASHVAGLKDEHGITPGLAVVLVGEDPASQVYVRNKVKQTIAAGMHSLEFKLPVSTSMNELLSVIRDLNQNPDVHGILVQMPLPGQLDEAAVINEINPAKDVDGFHPVNAGRLMKGDRHALQPCTPKGCILLAKHHLGDNLAGKHALVIGRSNIVGKPLATLLLQENCTVTVAHSKTDNLPDLCRQADIVFAAVGRAEMVRGSWIKPGATVIDIGISRVATQQGGTRLIGDVKYAEVNEIAGGITPVPGGVGPMTIACLLVNTLISCVSQSGIEFTEVAELR